MLVKLFLPSSWTSPLADIGSSSERNSKLLNAVLKISSVRDEPLVFKGESSALLGLPCFLI